MPGCLVGKKLRINQQKNKTKQYGEATKKINKTQRGQKQK